MKFPKLFIRPLVRLPRADWDEQPRSHQQGYKSRRIGRAVSFGQSVGNPGSATEANHQLGEFGIKHLDVASSGSGLNDCLARFSESNENPARKSIGLLGHCPVSYKCEGV